MALSASPIAEPVYRGAPFFDPVALRAELEALHHTHSGNDQRVRDAVLQRLKVLVADAHAAAQAQIEHDGSGRRCAQGLSFFQDVLIRLIYDFTVDHMYSAFVPSDAESMCVIATGGYGRGLLAPKSDIDLLFLLPYKQTAWGESVVEYILYLLWDLGFKVGHATRTVDQCLALAKSDMTIRTALLDSRLIFGDDGVFTVLEKRYRRDVVRGTGREFIEAKLGERDDRHKRSGASRYEVEPNIKEGKGGLRDLHTLHWLIKYLSGMEPGQAAIDRGLLSPSEAQTFRRCVDFLWTVRCHLHFLTNRPEERLSFEVQRELAARLGYTRNRPGLRAVERFMKHYFLVAKDVGDLMNTVCAALEVQQLKTTPTLNRLLAPLNWRDRRQLRRRTDFRIDNGRIDVLDDQVFVRDPVNLIRLFTRAEEFNVPFHPNAIRLVRSSLRLINEKLRHDPEANRIFIELLTSPQGPEEALRRMNEVGVLGRFVPEFGRVVSMMQFNMYHHYTVDEHLIRTVGHIKKIEQGEAVTDLPLSTGIIKTIQNRRALYVAAFLHDIGKGRAEDHSVVGARVARKLCPRFGLSAAETETVVWLIAQHLTMSNVAQSRDISDPKTIADFAAIVQSPERLKLLLLLTVVDIRAVGPGVWNGWKGQLLRTLYYETEPAVAGGHSTASYRERTERAKDTLRTALFDWSPGDVERFIDRHYDDFWLKTDPSRQADHARLIRRVEQAGETFATEIRADAFQAVTELTVLAPNHPRLLAIFAGACAAAGANIVGAHISTTRDGLALDTFRLQREFDSDADERRRAERIAATIGKLLKGQSHLRALMQQKREIKGRARAFRVEPEIIINNTQSDKQTVLEVSGLDRPGLLFDLTNAISDLNLDIASAHITTFGEKAVDVFYVTDLTGNKIRGEQRQTTIRKRLLAALSDGPPQPPQPNEIAP